MDNKFNINNYFVKWYGLGAAPTVNKLNLKPVGIIVTLVLLIAAFAVNFAIIILAAIAGLIFIGLPIMKKNKEQKAYDEWNNNFKIRSTTWHEEFDKFLDKTLSDLNLKQRGLGKVGIDESQIDDITEQNTDAAGVKSFSVFGRNYKGFYRKDINGNYRTQYYEVTWIFLTKDQILTYHIQLNLLDLAKKSEDTQEFFYDDIVSVSTSSETIEAKAEQAIDSDNEGSEEVTNETFKLVVPGDKISYSFTPTEEAVKSVKGLAKLIRDKKNKAKA